MALYLDDICDSNLEVQTEQAPDSVRFAQHAQDLILRLRLLKNASKDLGSVLEVGKFVAIFKFFPRGCVARGENAVFVEGQPEDVIVGIAARQGGAGEPRREC